MVDKKAFMESIYIKNFGPIKEVRIDDIKKISVFIGESGGGKSTIMKVIALFRWLYKMMNIRSYLKYSKLKKSPFRFNFLGLLKSSNLIDYLKNDSILKYKNGSLELCWDSSSKKLTGTTNYIPKEELSLEKISFISDKRSIISDVLDNSVSLKKSMYYLSETYNDFEMALEQVKETRIVDLGVKFVAQKTSQGIKYKIVPDDGSSSYGIKLTASSSGTQSLVPLNVIVEYYSNYYDLVASINKAILSYVSKSDSLSIFRAVQNIGDFSRKNVHLIVEEPELSLFPSSQCELLSYLVKNIYGDANREYQLSLMFATHSPYMLNFINVLLKRYYCGVTDKSIINPDDLAVYRVYEGQIQNLVGSDESGRVLVDASDLSEEMDNIYNEYIGLK